MGCVSGPEITLSDLSMNLDARNTRSYSGTGNSWIDSLSGNIRTIISSVSYVGTGSSASFLFNGTAGVIDATSSATLKVTTNWALGFWCLPKSYGQSNGVIYQLGTGSLTGFRLYTDATELGLILNTYAVAGFSAKAANTISLHQWQHFHLSFSSGVVTWYKNGVSIGTSSVTSPSAAAGTMNAYIGNSSDGLRTFDGNISQLRVYTKALTAEQVLKNYNSTKGRYR